MNLSSRSIALIVSASVAALVIALLIFAEYLSFRGKIVAFGATFIIYFTLLYLTFEFLIFREVNNIYAGLEKLKRKDFRQTNSASLFRPAPLERIKEEIYQIAADNQKEIDELKRLQVLRREFLADVSHELKTPVFAAQGFIHTLLDGAKDDEVVRDKFLLKAARSLDNLDTLVQDLITISQIEKGVVKMRKHNFDMVELTQEVFEQLEFKAADREISLHLDHPADSPVEVFADRNRIRQVLINLTDNAIKYGRHGGNIWISFQEGKKKFTVTVKDDGNGVAPEHQTRIFERFYRIDKSRTRDNGGGGSGLGLSISKHIVEAHRSVIGISSEVGVGTTLKFKLLKAKLF